MVKRVFGKVDGIEVNYDHSKGDWWNVPVPLDIDGEYVDENTVAVNIRRLREKIKDNSTKPEYLKNVRGLGYVWDKEVR